MNKKLITILLLTSLAAAAVSAAPMTLDRETAVELALENNPDFIISGIDLETAERDDSTAWNSFLPSISASVGVTGGTNLFDIHENDFSWSGSASLSVSMPLKVSMAYQIKGLQLAYEAEEISYEAARLSLISSVETEFYYLLAVRENLDIVAADLRLAQERYDQAAAKYDAGLASELEMLQAEVTAANKEPTYLQTVADYEARVREYLIVLGLDPDTEIELSGDLETPEASFNSDDLIRQYLSSRTDVQAGEKSLEMAENSKTNTAVSARVPSLNLSTGWNTNIGDVFNAGSWNYDTWVDGLSLGISMSIPLDSWIPGSSDSVSIKSAQDSIDKAAVQLAKTVEEARTEIINLVAQLETSAANLALSDLNVELAKKTYDLSEASYERGTIQYLDVEDAQQDYLEAVQQDLVSRYEYMAGLIDLRTALGLDSLEGLI